MDFPRAVRFPVPLDKGNDEPVGRVQFVVFEKFTSAYLFQIAREKSFDYLTNKEA